jgi:Dockerin type I domain
MLRFSWQALELLCWAPCLASIIEESKQLIRRLRCGFRVGRLFVLIGALLALMASSAAAQLYINEIFFDPGGKFADTENEYIELRGTPNMSLANTYLIFLENEDTATHDGTTGQIDNIFDLSSQSLGSNGFLSLRQNGNRYPNPAPGATDLVNDGPGAGVGWGSGPTSSIGASDVGGDGVIENRGFTAMLINKGTGPTPTLGMALDGNVNNDNAELVGGMDPTPHDGLDYPTGQPGWTIFDSIGVHAAAEAYYGRTYAQVNFGALKVGTEVLPGIFFDMPNIEPGATYTGLGYEIEYIARWGNSTGQTPDDWHVSNLTDKPNSGSDQSLPDWRQSCVDNQDLQCHPDDDGNPLTPPPLGLLTESNQGVPYGTQLMHDIGAPNFLLGDYNKDGYVNAADYTVWRDALGQTGSDSIQLAADADHDYVVGISDFAVWKAHFGQPFAAGAASLATFGVPEPASLILALAGTIAVAAFRSRTRCC